MSYFGIVVTDGYDWNQCYSWAWECATYWDTDSKTGGSRSVYEAFPDVEWQDAKSENDQPGAMNQIMAIELGLADRPAKIFFEKKVIIRRGVG